MVFLIVTAVVVVTEATPKQLEMHAELLRRRGDRPSPTMDAELNTIAQRWAEHMATQSSMYHGGGEQIIARGYSTVPRAFTAWMNSSGHRAWLLSSSTRVGWGAAQSSSGQWYYAGAFRGGRPSHSTTSTSSRSYRPRWRSRRRR